MTDEKLIEEMVQNELEEANKKRIYEEMKKASIRAIQESIQVAAMCDKAIASIEWRRGGR